MRCTAAAIAAALVLAGAAQANADLDESALRATMDAYAATLSVDGAGVEAYAEFLAEDYTRWGIGGPVMTRAELIDGVAPWWADGNRVASRESEIIDLTIDGEHAFVRAYFEEEFVGREGPTGSFRGYVATTWRATPEGWRLIRSDQIQAPPEE